MNILKNKETVFLKLTLVLISLPIIAGCVWGIPWILKEALLYYPKPLVYLVVAVVYVAVIPYFYALTRANRLLGLIDTNNAFSSDAVKALKHIKICGLAITSLYVLILPLIYLVAEVDDAPGILLLALVIMFASFVIAAFAALLEKLLEQAIAIKEENDLTV